MRAVNYGNSFDIYDNSVKLHNGLPPKVYGVNFDPMKGFSLFLHEDIEIHEKVYGVHEAKVEKVLRSFKAFERSLGVILSGDKGIGKSLFAKMLCQKATQMGYPVVVCDAFHPGVARFLDSMDQELVVLFDEFDKTFSNGKNGEANQQAAMLSLFDGVSMNKKLFVVTCNDTINLNDFLVNRPGRFHYHFRFEYPNQEEIETYMRDHIPEKRFGEIEKIVNFAKKVNLNYDCLRAIAYELKTCESFEEAVSDLNITKNNRSLACKTFVLFKDGTFVSTRFGVDLFSDEEICLSFGDSSVIGYDYFSTCFTPSDAVYREDKGGLFIPVEMLKVEELFSLDDENFGEKDKNYILSHRTKDVVGLLIKPESNNKPIHYFKA